MSTETEHNEHLDLFSLKVKQKLEDHRLPVDVECWEQIEAKVGGRPRLSVWRIGGWATLAAAVLALLFLIRLNPTVPVPTLDAGSQKEEPIAGKTNPEKTDTQERVVAYAVQKRAVVPIPADTVAWEEMIGEEEIELPPKAEVTHPATPVSAVRHLGPEP